MKCDNCGETLPFVVSKHVCKTADVSESAVAAGSVAGLQKIADDLIGYGEWTKQNINGEDGNLPTLWDLEEVVINYKKIVRSE